MAAGPLAHRERIGLPWGGWLAAAFVTSSIALVLVVVVDLWIAVLTAALVAAALAYALVRTALVVEVDGTTLRAGRARIPLAVLGAAVPLDAGQAARLRGRDIDPRAYHAMRGWVATAVRVEVVDPRDPTPYWYVSTRRPEALAAAVAANG